MAVQTPLHITLQTTIFKESVRSLKHDGYNVSLSNVSTYSTGMFPITALWFPAAVDLTEQGHVRASTGRRPDNRLSQWGTR